MNQVTISGRIGKDPEIRYAGNGTPVCKFTVADSESQKVGDEWKTKTIWHNVVAFNKTAENIHTKYAKGSGIMFTGRMQDNTWVDKEGKEVKAVNIVIDKIWSVPENKNARQNPIASANTMTPDPMFPGEAAGMDYLPF